jgi:hypothetical protein
MDLSYSVNIVTIGVFVTGAGFAYKVWADYTGRVNRRLGAIETFLTERFGDPNQHFKPGNGGR